MSPLSFQRRRLVSTLPALVLAAMGLLAAGCAGDEKEPAVDLGDPSEFTVIAGDTAAYQDPANYQQNVGLHARMEGNALVVSMHNQRQQEITLTHTDLAIITGANPDDMVFINPATADLRKFTPLILKPGQRGVRRLPMKTGRNYAGMRLVYNNPRQQIRFFVSIQ